MQPWFPFVWLKQSVEMSLPLSIEEEAEASGCLHPLSVCSEMLFCVCKFTPSMMSISPELGHSPGPRVQKAGQTEHCAGYYYNVSTLAESTHAER